MLHDRIRELRERKGWSQARLGESINMGDTVISRIESGKKQVRAAEVQKIADAMGYPVSLFFDADAQEADASPTEPVGLAEELLPYEPEPGNPFAAFQRDNRYLLTVNCDSLTRIGVTRGDIVVVDGDATACATLKAGAIVRVQYHPTGETYGKAATLLRQFFPPGILVTNSSETNAPALFLAHDDVQVMGVVVSVHRAYQG
jgi:transcriptional regulator with XRE-family HTH domain